MALTPGSQIWEHPRHPLVGLHDEAAHLCRPPSRLPDGSRSHRETLNLLCTPRGSHMAMAAYLYSDGFTLCFLPCAQFEAPELQHSRAIWQIDTSVLCALRAPVMESSAF